MAWSWGARKTRTAPDEKVSNRSSVRRYWEQAKAYGNIADNLTEGRLATTIAKTFRRALERLGRRADNCSSFFSEPVELAKLALR